MKMVRRKEDTKKADKEEIVGVIEIPVTAEAASIVKLGQSPADMPHAVSHRAGLPPVGLPSPTTVIRVDLINLLDDLEAELRAFHRKVRESHKKSA